MSPENCKLIYSLGVKVGDSLKGKLTATTDHPERNSYAHVWRSVKDKFGKSYKDCEDSQLNDVVALIKQLEMSA
jgi:hypothetical protein